MQDKTNAQRDGAIAMPRPPHGPGDGDDDQELPIGDPPDDDETDDPDDEDEGEEDEDPLYSAAALRRDAHPCRLPRSACGSSAVRTSRTTIASTSCGPSGITGFSPI
jgi:hypothetical protein